MSVQISPVRAVAGQVHLKRRKAKTLAITTMKASISILVGSGTTDMVSAGTSITPAAGSSGASGYGPSVSSATSPSGSSGAGASSSSVSRPGI